MNNNIVAGTVDQDKIRYALDPQDHLLVDLTISFVLVWGSHTTDAAVSGVQISI